MTFGYPIALVALVALPALVGIYVLHERRRRAAGARFARLALLPNTVGLRMSQQYALRRAGVGGNARCKLQPVLA